VCVVVWSTVESDVVVVVSPVDRLLVVAARTEWLVRSAAAVVAAVV
jgi:hypothetical protein